MSNSASGKRIRPKPLDTTAARMDHQVKVRGFRIELGEIEAVLASHPGLHEAVVVVKKDKSGAERLVAYMVGEGEEAVGKVLRGYLRERLPEFMVPQAFVSLSSLPLTPNGKVDRRALQGLEVEFESSGDQSVMARTPVEEILSGIWAEVLGCETVSVYDSFLELRGHSLLERKSSHASVMSSGKRWHCAPFWKTTPSPVLHGPLKVDNS